jgi:hypothetical protein
VLAFLRFVGILNAAVWFGAAIFFTVAVGPAFFSPEMVNLVGRPRTGVAVQLVLQRYFVVQHWCGLIAVGHLLAEWLYTGRPFQKLTLGVLLALLVLGLLGHFWLQPKLSRLHLEIYEVRSTPAPEQVEKARHSFGAWHATAQSLNLVMIFGLVYYLWRITHPSATPRFVSANRFRLE